VLTIVYILTWFINLESWLANIPYYTLFYFELYRLLLSPLVGNSFLTLIITFMVYPSLGIKMENSMGSSAFLYLMIFATLAVNILFVVLCVLWSLLSSSSYALTLPSMDFWILLFALIALDCMQQPDMPRRLMFIPMDIPSKYIPVILYVLICLFSGFVLSYALSLLVGYLWMRGALDRFKPSSQYLEQLEAEGGWLHSASRSSGWVLAGTLGHDAWIPVNTVDASEHGQQHGSRDASSAGSGGFFSSGARQANAGQDGQAPESFPGSGRKLTDSTSSSAAGAASASGLFGNLPSASAAYSGIFARPPDATTLPVATAVPASSLHGHSSTGGTVLPNREEVAARRLAALEAQQRLQSNGNSSQPSAPLLGQSSSSYSNNV
jgi:hypothetical protein